MHIAEAGTGPLVVLLHGFPELWYSWRYQLPVLAAGYHAGAPDLGGYGETDASEAVDSYGMRDLTADVVGLLDALGTETPVLVGHDWGASIAWAYAERHPPSASCWASSAGWRAWASRRSSVGSSAWIGSRRSR